MTIKLNQKEVTSTIGAQDKVKVAVRVRPFNRRENELGTESVVEVCDQQILLQHPNSSNKNNTERRRVKNFAFDSCFWSFDEADAHFADQEQVFNDCGKPVLDSAFEGYNACIFAYGQTGSGKSYTMMGTPSNEGLIPRLCNAIFERIAESNNAHTSFKVEVSYMEIYNEKVHDLLDPRGKQQNLRVREHNILGPYVDGLSMLAVSSFKEINNLMAEGNKSRTVAATNMNSESSRSHAVFSIILTCLVSDPQSGVTGEKVSKMSLVDLAGSERAVKTGAVGERLKEGSNINKSLTTLGLVISKLADSSAGKSRSDQFVPYRDSVLTWLLKDNLGGNSKTVMVATISPAGDNYEETLSTLRYADRAKRIVNHAVVNEDPNARMIRELREEVDMLRSRLKNANEQDDLRDRLSESEKLIKEMTQTWEEKLRHTETVQQERQQALERMGISVQSSGIKVETNKYYLVNLNADPSLNELLVYYLKERTLVGRADSATTQDIQLSGIGIAPEHCVIEIDSVNNQLYVEPLDGARTCVNGILIKERRLLKHGDRLLWGSNHFFRVACPKTADQDRFEAERQTIVSSDEESQHEQDIPIDFRFAQEELMMNELSNNPIQNCMRSLEAQHEEDKNRALERQRNIYEKQIKMLRSQVTPSTPYGPYGFEQMSTSGSRSNLNSPSASFVSSMDRWEKERDELFRQSLVKLKEDIIRANSLVLEANSLAGEMSRYTEFKVTLQIPAGNLTPNRRRGSFVSEPAILVRRKHKSPQVWSIEKLENKLIDMRDLYEEWKEKGGLQAFRQSQDADPSITLLDPFYESQENHHLIGVANVFLEVLFHDVSLDYQVPIINQQGEVAGRLHIEICRISGIIGERVADASDSLSDIDSCAGSSVNDGNLVIRVTVKAAHGLPLSLSNFVFCQYTFWGLTDPVVVPPHIEQSPNRQTNGAHKDITSVLRFDHVREFTVPANEEFLEHCAEGALSIEVWGHRSAGFSSTKTDWEVVSSENGGRPKQMEVHKSLAHRWAELKRCIELWVEVQELNEQGDYSPVEVQARPDNLTGGVYQLRQGQQRRVMVRVKPVQDSGTLPVICESITSLAIGCVCVRSRPLKPLDSYQDDDLSALNQRWSDILDRRKKYLDEQIQKLINKSDKTEEDAEREQSLIEQWVSLTEERNAVKCPTPGSGIPGSPAGWCPPAGMEEHVPVLFLDLNTDDMIPTMLGGSESSAWVAGSHSILPKEHGSQFFNLPLVRPSSDSADVSTIAVWDSSMHNSVFLNRVTEPNERVYVILKAVVRLSHPTLMDLVLRKRMAINVYKKQSAMQFLKRKLVGSDSLAATGVTYEVVSSIPRASEDHEDRESLALLAASSEDATDAEGESYIEKYTKGVSAVESILALDRLRQQVAVKELLTMKGSADPSFLLKKTSSVPNMGLMLGSPLAGGSMSRLDGTRSDSSFDISSLANQAYEGLDKLRQRMSNSFVASPDGRPSNGSQDGYGRPYSAGTAIVNTLTSPHSTKFMKPMSTLEEVHLDEEEEEGEQIDCHERDENRMERMEPIQESIKSMKFNTYNNFSEKQQHETSGDLRDTQEHRSTKVISTPSVMSSGYGSQPLLDTPNSSQDSLSIQSAASNEELSQINEESSVRMDSHNNWIDKTEETVAEEIKGRDLTSPGLIIEEQRENTKALPSWMVVGESVRISPDSKTGMIAFIGGTHFASGTWIGVVLDSPIGKNDGTVNDVAYFHCKPRYGIFVRPEKLKLDPRGRLLRVNNPPEITSNNATAEQHSLRSSLPRTGKR